MIGSNQPSHWVFDLKGSAELISVDQ